MNNQKNRLLLLVVSLLVLCACGKKESAEEGDSGAKTHHEKNIVTLSEESLKNLDLKTEMAVIGSLERKLKVPGRTSPDLNRTAKVSATLEGRIAKLIFDLGDQVSEGAIMGQVESPELLDKPLLLRALVAGVVTEKSVTLGELVGKGQEIYSLSDPSHIWLIGEVRERDVALVHDGQKVDFTVLSYPDEIFHGNIARIGGAVETDSRTFEIRVEIDNKNGKLKPGMFADMVITTEVLRNALIISAMALQTDGKEQIAFVALDGNRFERRVVKLGHEQDDRVQILEGIKAGEKIVTEGSFTLKSEMLKGELGEE